MHRWELTATFSQFGTQYKRRWTFRTKHQLDDHDRIIRKNSTFQHSRATRINELQPDGNKDCTTAGLGQLESQEDTDNRQVSSL